MLSLPVIYKSRVIWKSLLFLIKNMFNTISTYWDGQVLKVALLLKEELGHINDKLGKQTPFCQLGEYDTLGDRANLMSVFGGVYFFHPSPRRSDRWVLPASTPSSSGTEWRSGSGRPSKSGDRIPGRKTRGNRNKISKIKRDVLFMFQRINAELIFRMTGHLLMWCC